MTLFRPRTWEMSIPIVTANWFIVPMAPLRLVGDTSELYIGVTPVYKPVDKNEKKMNKYIFHHTFC